MSFWERMKVIVEEMREHAKTHDALRQKMMEESRYVTEVSSYDTDFDARHCRSYGHRPTKIPARDDTVKSVTRTLFDVFKPTALDLGLRPKLSLTLSTAEAISSNFFQDEFDKMNHEQLQEAYNEVDALINVVDAILSGVSAALSREHQQNMSDYLAERRRTGDVSTELFQKYMRRSDSHLSDQFQCYSIRRKQLSNLRSKLADRLLRWHVKA